MNDIVDMSRFVEAKSDQLNADDLIGTTRTITVRRVAGCDGDQPIAIYYEGDNNKPFKPCKTMRRVLLGVWGRNGNDYVGRSMTLYRDDKVTFGGLEVGGIRISHMSHIEKEVVVVVMKTKGKKAGIKILPLKTEPKEDPAAKWSADFIATLNRAPDSEKLEQFVTSRAGKLDDLERQRPELHAECTHAIENKRQSFNVLDEWGSGNDDWQEGPTDEQRGEAHTETDLLEMIQSASSREEWEAAEKAVGAADMTDNERLELSRALEAKRAELVGGKK
ncbi:hypothetical protein [Novosphingobium sp. KN65.2]|uniref:hypothetical protein n=1 Tax=Novosphingobium sp. KN65.2 TaxID=1478134 RepID=UPI0005DC7B1A|nr:hypothetical protein [Novosphingobium sp. KN65.2]CDO38948.1 hypothetical protein SPHV1_880001 [Novosphingobium sp. KN65.2]